MGNALEVPEPVKKQLEERGGVETLVTLLEDEEALLQRAGTLQALSEPIRLKVLVLLRAQPLCPCILTRVVGVADSKLSYHLSMLQETGLIEAEQKGRWLIYSLTEHGRRALAIVRQLDVARR